MFQHYYSKDNELTKASEVAKGAMDLGWCGGLWGNLGLLSVCLQHAQICITCIERREHGEVKHPNWLVISPAVEDLFAHLRFEAATLGPALFFHILRAKGVLVDVGDMKHRK